MMKKQSVLWSMAMMFLLGTFTFASCGSDDDENTNTSTSGTQTNNVPDGFYEVQYNGKGGVDYLVDQYILSAQNRGDYNYILDRYFIQDIMDNHPYIYYGFYIYQSKYMLNIYTYLSYTENDRTYAKKVITYGDEEVYCYYDLGMTADYIEPLSSLQYTYSNGTILYDNSLYKRRGDMTVPTWLLQSCSDLVNDLK